MITNNVKAPSMNYGQKIEAEKMDQYGVWPNTNAIPHEKEGRWMKDLRERDKLRQQCQKWWQVDSFVNVSTMCIITAWRAELYLGPKLRGWVIPRLCRVEVHWGKQGKMSWKAVVTWKAMESRNAASKQRQRNWQTEICFVLCTKQDGNVTREGWGEKEDDCAIFVWSAGQEYST